MNGKVVAILSGER